MAVELFDQKKWHKSLFKAFARLPFALDFGDLSAPIGTPLAVPDLTDLVWVEPLLPRITDNVEQADSTQSVAKENLIADGTCPPTATIVNQVLQGYRATAALPNTNNRHLFEFYARQQNRYLVDQIIDYLIRQVLSAALAVDPESPQDEPIKIVFSEAQTRLNTELLFDASFAIQRKKNLPRPRILFIPATAESDLTSCPELAETYCQNQTIRIPRETQVYICENLPANEFVLMAYDAVHLVLDKSLHSQITGGSTSPMVQTDGKFLVKRMDPNSVVHGILGSEG